MNSKNEMQSVSGFADPRFTQISECSGPTLSRNTTSSSADRARPDRWRLVVFAENPDGQCSAA